MHVMHRGHGLLLFSNYLVFPYLQEQAHALPKDLHLVSYSSSLWCGICLHGLHLFACSSAFLAWRAAFLCPITLSCCEGLSNLHSSIRLILHGCSAA